MNTTFYTAYRQSYSDSTHSYNPVEQRKWVEFFKIKASFIIIFMLLVSLIGCTSKKPQSIQAVSPPTLEIAQENFRAGSYPKALSQLNFLAIHNDPEAQYALGYMYYYGLGTPQNPDLARGWFRESAAAGFEPSKQALNQIDQPVVGAFPGYMPTL